MLSKHSRSKETEETRIAGMEPLLRKAVLAAFTVLGTGFVLVNVPITLLLGYSVSRFQITSQQAVTEIAGRLLFILASAAFMVVGVLLVIAAIYYDGIVPKGIIFLGALSASFYLLCLGLGSTLLSQEANFHALLMIVAPILIVASATLYMMPSFHPKINGSMLGAVLGVLGGIILAEAVYKIPILNLAFEWDVPFTGPFMSIVVLESIAVVLVPITALLHSFYAIHSKGTTLTHTLLSLVALIYGIGLFIGSLVLSLGFWNWIWKVPWTGPFHGMPSWALSTIIFWSASLFLIGIGGIILVASSFLGFISVARELS